jgi:hypothetical protein
VSEQTENIGEDPNKQPVDRGRRFKYIAWVTGFCLISALTVTFVAGILLNPTATSPLLDLYVRGVLGIASATVIAYVSGSVIDYNGGIGKLFSGKPKD